MKILDRGLIFDATQAPPNQRSCAFTSVARLSDGTLLVAFRNATGRDAPDGRVRVMRSRDDGGTWETLHAGLTGILDGVEGNFYVAYFTELTPGHMLGAFKWVDRSNPSLSYVNPVTTGILPMRILLTESRDGGATWGPYRLASLAPHKGASMTGPIWRLPTGALALPFETWKEYDDTSLAVQMTRLRLSYDEGQTWTDDLMVAYDPEQHILYWDNRIAIHPISGQLVAMFWTHDRRIDHDLPNHITWGSPDGTTWTTPSPTPLHGQHCQPIALGGDGLLAVYVHRQDPPSLRAVGSQDFGRTWDMANELVFYDSRVGTEPGMAEKPSHEEFWQDMMAWRFGHPRGTLLPDGSVLVAYYAGDHHATSMHWVRIDPSP